MSNRQFWDGALCQGASPTRPPQPPPGPSLHRTCAEPRPLGPGLQDLTRPALPISFRHPSTSATAESQPEAQRDSGAPGESLKEGGPGKPGDGPAPDPGHGPADRTGPCWVPSGRPCGQGAGWGREAALPSSRCQGSLRRGTGRRGLAGLSAVSTNAERTSLWTEDGGRRGAAREPPFHPGLPTCRCEQAPRLLPDATSLPFLFIRTHHSRNGYTYW